MRIKAVIMCHNTQCTTDALYYALEPILDVTVFNVGSEDGKGPTCPHDNYPNIYYTGCWKEAMRRFGDYDVLWVIGGDVTLKNTGMEYREAIETSMPFAFWSPVVDGYSRAIMHEKLVQGRVLNVYHIEGIAMAVSHEIMEKINYSIPEGSTLGWGIDLWMSLVGWNSPRCNILDGRVVMKHPETCGYSRPEAMRQMYRFLSQMFGPTWPLEVRSAEMFSSFSQNIRSVLKNGIS